METRDGNVPISFQAQEKGNNMRRVLSRVKKKHWYILAGILAVKAVETVAVIAIVFFFV